MKVNPSPKCYVPLPKFNKSQLPQNNNSLSQHLPLSPPYHLSPSQSHFDLQQHLPCVPENSKLIVRPPSQLTESYRLKKINSNGKVNRGSYYNLIASPSRLKPKISFSYNKDRTHETSGKQIHKQSYEQHSSVLEFQLRRPTSSLQTKIARLKIHSNILQQLYKPVVYSAQDPTQITETIEHVEKSNNNEESFPNKQSKMASTELSQSYTTDSRNTEFCSSLKLTQQSTQKDRSLNMLSLNNIQLSLLERLSPEKILRKTSIENNNYDFGGIFHHENKQRNQKTLPKLASQGQTPVPTHKWSNLVKGLFQEESGEQCLKKSIHCGPQLRQDGFQCVLLSQYAGEMTQSIVPVYD